MRIIAGSFRGRKILEPKNINTRPLKDLAKESIFNIIEHSNKFKIDLSIANVLDLFSGVGSFGIECLSRGARKVIFIENYLEVLPILKKNLSNLSLKDHYEIIEKDVYKDDTLLNLNKKFDIIFLDPPFKDKNLFNLVSKLINFKMLSENGVIILHRHINEKEILPKYFKVIEERKYGISKIFFISNLN